MPNQTIHSVDVQTYSSLDARDEAMKRQLIDILERIDAEESVTASREMHDAAQRNLEALREARTRLMRENKALIELMNGSQRAAEDAMIANVTAGVTDPMFAELSAAEIRQRVVSRASQRLVERLLPEAEIVEMEAKAKHLLSQATKLRAESEARIEKTAQLLSQAAEFEGNISFDASNTLSGALIEQAKQYENQADSFRRWANERADKLQQTLRELDSLRLLGI